MTAIALDIPLISIIVPCYNAAGTLPATVQSALAQTYPRIEIILVDDGSTDDTSAVMAALAAQDDRITVLSQENAGVAAARNLGIAAARGDFIATLDADDLWAPEKLEAQMRCFSDPDVGVVYTWFEHIDENDRVFSGGFHFEFSGDVFEQLCAIDFIGNGSNALTRAHLMRDVGGYDTALRARGAEGCEDWKIALLLAERTRFAVVPRALLGYRLTWNNMSSQFRKFTRSAEIVIDEFSTRHPKVAPILERHQIHREVHALIRSTLRGHFGDALWLLRRWPDYGFARPFWVLVKIIVTTGIKALGRAPSKVMHGGLRAGRVKFLGGA